MTEDEFMLRFSEVASRMSHAAHGELRSVVVCAAALLLKVAIKDTKRQETPDIALNAVSAIDALVFAFIKVAPTIDAPAEVQH